MIVDLKEQYLTDNQGNRVGVLIGLEAYKRLLGALEELESLRAYDAAVVARDAAIPFEQAVEEIRRDRA